MADPSGMLHPLGRSYQSVSSDTIINPERKTSGCFGIGGYMASFITFHELPTLILLTKDWMGRELKTAVQIPSMSPHGDN